MTTEIFLDGPTLVGVANAAAGEVSGDTRFEFEQEDNRIYAHYAGGDILDGHLVGTFDGREWDTRYTQRTRLRVDTPSLGRRSWCVLIQ